MSGVLSAMGDRKICGTFYNYYSYAIDPLLFHWPASAVFLDNYFALIRNDNKDWTDYWLPAITAGGRFLEGRVPIVRIEGVEVRRERIQHVFHMYVLAMSANVYLANVTQVLELGAGTGDNVPLFRQLGLEGEHIVIDLPPMLVLQQYFIRYSGWPVYLDETMDGLRGRKDILWSSFELDRLRAYLGHGDKEEGEGEERLFLATWSLTELSLSDRNALLTQLPEIQEFSTLLIAFAGVFDGVNNTQEMIRWAEKLQTNYSTCMWAVPLMPSSYYFIARKSSLGEVRCSSVVGCNEESFVFGQCRINNQEERKRRNSTANSIVISQSNHADLLMNEALEL